MRAPAGPLRGARDHPPRRAPSRPQHVGASEAAGILCAKVRPPKAMFGLFYPPCYICYGLHAWLRSSNCRESGRVHWRDRLTYLSRHEAHNHRELLCAPHRLTRDTPSPQRRRDPCSPCGRGPPPPLSRGGRPHSSSHGLPRQLELGAHSSRGLRIRSRRTPARLTVAMMAHRPSLRTLAPKWTRTRVERAPPRLGRRSTAAPSASSCCSAPSCSRAATVSAAAAGCAYSRAARRGQLLAAPAE